MNDLELKSEDVDELLDRIQEAYEKVRDELEADSIISWNELSSSYFGIDVPDMNTPEWTHYVQRRSQMKTAVNNRASKMGQAWRLYIHQQGAYVIKKQKTPMVKAEIVHRMKRIAGALDVAAVSAREMAQAEGLNKRDKQKLKQTMNASEGARLSFTGMISQMDVLDKATKQLLISMFDSDEELDDE